MTVENNLYINKIVACIMLVTILILVYGCGTTKNIKDSKFFIVETTDEKNKGVIKIYNKEMNIVNKVECDKANIGSVTSYAKIANNSLFVTAQESNAKNGTTSVLELNIGEDKVNEFKLKYPLIRDICIDKDYLYSVNSMGDEKFKSYICKYDLKNHSCKEEVIIDNIIVSHISVYEDKIIAIGMNYEQSGKIFSKLYEINKSNLEIKKEINISNYAISVNSSVKYNDNIYFSIETELGNYDTETSDRIEETSQNLLVYNTKSGKISKINVGFTANQLIVYKGCLIITNYDPVYDVGTKIMLYDIEDGSKKTYDLKQTVRQAQMEEHYLYVMSEDTFCKYDIDDDLSNIFTKKLESDSIETEYSYNSTFAIK